MNPYKMVVAVANQKGGCAKTTTAVNLAAALAKGNPKFKVPPAKVLLIDLDPQGNCATSFGVEKKKIKKTAYDLLVNDGGEDLPLMEEYIISPAELTESMQKAWSKRTTIPAESPKTSLSTICGYFQATSTYLVLK